MTAAVKAPHIDWAALSPLIALAGGVCVVLMLGLVRSRFVRRQVVPFLTLVALAATAGLSIWQWGRNTEVVSRALSIDDLTLTPTLVFVFAAGAACVRA